MSIVSITKSTVSQVDFKLQSNTTKKKLKGLLKMVDLDKSGFVKNEVFFQLIQLHGIDLQQQAISYLTKNYSKNMLIDYKEALNQLTIDLEVAGQTEADAKIQWTLNAFTNQKKNTINDGLLDSASQAGSIKYKTFFQVNNKQKNKESLLTKDKLQNLDLLAYKNGKLEPLIGAEDSQAQKSQAVTKSFLSKLEKIDEEVSKTSHAQGVNSIKQTMKKMFVSDRESFEKLIVIIIYVNNNNINPLLFSLINLAVSEFYQMKGRRMSVEELIDFCKLQFEDFKFIDQIIRFTKISDDKQNENKNELQEDTKKLENSFTVYVSQEKIQLMNDFVQQIQNIFPQNSKISHSSIMNWMANIKTKNFDIQSKKSYQSYQQSIAIKQISDEQAQVNQIQMKNDPRLQKIIEIIYTNLKQRFNVFGNAFRYLDFKNRIGISQEDFQKGLEGFGIRIPQEDRKQVFAYLTFNSLESLKESTLMSFSQFLRIKDEQKERNIDPAELQVFQEHISTLTREQELQLQSNQKKNLELESLSKASNNAYKGFNDQKQKSRFQRETELLPKNIRENLNTISFGCGTLPSDNMNMVMTHEFQNDFVRKMKEKIMIEQELEKLANIQSKNVKNNIYITKTQALRQKLTQESLNRKVIEDIENAYLQANHIPKLFTASSSPGLLKDLQNQIPKNYQQLPPLKKVKNSQEDEIIKLINSNLLTNKSQLKSINQDNPYIMGQQKAQKIQLKRSSSVRQSVDFPKIENLETNDKEVDNKENKLQEENQKNSE